MMEAAWGRPPSEVVVAVSPKPIAAASLGQACYWCRCQACHTAGTEAV